LSRILLLTLLLKNAIAIIPASSTIRRCEDSPL
jgi:hypothetical protein